MNGLIKTLFFVFLTSCAFQKPLIDVKNGQASTRLLPPNGVRMNDTLICDKTEVANIDYREYLYWQSQVFGDKSDKYLNAIPDLLLRFELIADSNLLDPIEYYFHHPAFKDYPTIGISYEQALAYSKWRSDRTYEMMLIENKVIQIYRPDSLNYFTIEKYRAGQFFNYKPTNKIPIPRFRLPSVEEWELIAHIEEARELEVNSANRKVLGYKKHGLLPFITREVTLEQKPTRSPLAPVLRFLNYKGHIYNIIGNAAEMTMSKGIAKGGSWWHTLEESKIKNNIPYKKPETWLGFRNVCVWEIPKQELNN